MWAVPRALPEYAGVSGGLEGLVAYPDHDVPVPAVSVDGPFQENLAAVMRRLAATEPPPRFPSPQECRFCPISGVDCPERVEWQAPVEAMTEVF